MGRPNNTPTILPKLIIWNNVPRPKQTPNPIRRSLRLKEGKILSFSFESFENGFKDNRIQVFNSTEKNDHYMYGDNDQICFGCSDDYFEEFEEGKLKLFLYNNIIIYR